MTLKEFDSTDWNAKMFIRVKGDLHQVAIVDFLSSHIGVYNKTRSGVFWLKPLDIKQEDIVRTPNGGI